MAPPNGSTSVGVGSGLTPEEDAEDLGLELREARETQSVSPVELGHRTGVAASDGLDFEARRGIPAEPQFAIYMRALGFTM